jgi:methylated-DNA-[protein]-cysteine S-methyltransferase
VAACSFAESTAEAARSRVIERAPTASVGDRELLAPVEQVVQQLAEYLAGTRVVFDVPLDLTALTPFTRRVLDATRQIPYGETRSYGWVADHIGCPGGAQAVGQALHRNPLPMIIPCHRVVGADGSLVGFGGGLDRKRQLLALEAKCETS